MGPYYLTALVNLLGPAKEVFSQSEKGISKRDPIGDTLSSVSFRRGSGATRCLGESTVLRWFTPGMEKWNLMSEFAASKDKRPAWKSTVPKAAASSAHIFPGVEKCVSKSHGRFFLAFLGTSSAAFLEL